MYWYDKPIEEPKKKEKRFIFKGVGSGSITGYVYAKDTDEALAKIDNNDFTTDDYEFEYIEVEEIEEEDD